MSYLSVNNKDVAEMKLILPRKGAWVADVAVLDESVISGTATVDIADGALQLVGTVKRGGAYLLTSYLRIIGGRNGLQNNATPRSYQNNVQLRTIVGDLANDAGESISSTSTDSVMSTNLVRWSSIQTQISGQFELAISYASPTAVYRFLPDGTIFVGEDSFPEFTEDFQILEEEPQDERFSVGLFAPTLTPGMTLDGRRVSYVEHTIKPDRSSTMVWFES